MKRLLFTLLIVVWTANAEAQERVLPPCPEGTHFGLKVSPTCALPRDRFTPWWFVAGQAADTITTLHLHANDGRRVGDYRLRMVERNQLFGQSITGLVVGKAISTAVVLSLVRTLDKPGRRGWVRAIGKATGRVIGSGMMHIAFANELSLHQAVSDARRQSGVQ